MVLNGLVLITHWGDVVLAILKLFIF